MTLLFFFLWSMFTPVFFLQQQYRARMLRQYMENHGEISRTYLHDYIEERLLCSNANVQCYLAIHELRTDFEQWLAKASLLEDINDRPKVMKYLPNNIMEILSVDYKIKVERIRPSINKQRCYALSNILLIHKDYDTALYGPIKFPKNEAFSFNGLDPFLAIEYLTTPDIEEEEFIQKQDALIKDRLEQENRNKVDQSHQIGNSNSNK